MWFSFVGQAHGTQTSLQCLPTLKLSCQCLLPRFSYYWSFNHVPSNQTIAIAHSQFKSVFLATYHFKHSRHQNVLLNFLLTRRIFLHHYPSWSPLRVCSAASVLFQIAPASHAYPSVNHAQDFPSSVSWS